MQTIIDDTGSHTEMETLEEYQARACAAIKIEAARRIAELEGTPGDFRPARWKVHRADQRAVLGDPTERDTLYTQIDIVRQQSDHCEALVMAITDPMDAWQFDVAAAFDAL